MNRRVGGVLVLLVGLFAVLVVPRVLDPGVSGAAVRAPLPGPPGIGTCMTLASPLSESGDWTVPSVLSEFELVPCGELHDYEVAWTWEPGEWVAPAPSAEFEDSCAAAWNSYPLEPDKVLGHWQLSLVRLSVRLVAAPPTQTVGEMGWHACIVSPDFGSPYRGVMLGTTDIRYRPAAFGNCGWDFGGGIGFTSCDQPHEFENLALAWSQTPDDPSLQAVQPPLPDEAVLRSECEQLAADLLDRADPTYDGQLEVTMEYEATPNQQVWVDYDLDAELAEAELVSGTNIQASCSIKAANGANLLDTLVGIGDKPLPVQN